ncbi:apolipoprotein N-acyltransferase [Chondromyces apiculatus]|uniref:Apolipoprotein N-acyltransferase n=1 Tax=Chondromyces apiculatus DSM 436 TaxID=1192034 RepID=A0A017T1M8_9BACT|nr:apolipoprotein N-acyltransferase [Chondromyces apiculatus]EYF02456.1 Apolipoprotein N-acyltransferase [Chondromyces apiculatus DSM 436]
MNTPPRALPSRILSSRPLPARPAYALAALSGLLYFLGFPGVDLWPLAFIGLAPLIVALRGQTPRRAAGLGWMAGFIMTMTGFYWLLNMLKVFSGFPTALCFVFMILLCAYQGGRIALCGYLYGRAETRGWPPAPVFALAFVASELVYPLLFPWYFGASVHNAPVFLQVADLGGPYLIGLVLVAANLAVAEIAKAWLDLRQERLAPAAASEALPPEDRDARGLKAALRRRPVLLAGVAIPALAALYGLYRMRAVDSAAAVAEPIKVGIVQPNLALFDRKNALRIHQQRTQELKSQGAQLVVWSEASIPRMFPEKGHELAVQRDITRRLGVPAIIGTLLHRPGPTRTDPGFSYNTALMADEEGKIVGRFDKHYLLAFGEYLPLGDTFPKLYELSPNSGHFNRGTSLDPLVWKDHKITAMICYEDILPDFVNKLVAQGDPDLFVNLTNDAWFGDSTEPWIHLALAKLRSVEHHRYLVRATNSGVSAIIDPVGRVVTHGGTFREETVFGEARFMRSRSLYNVIRDVPWYLATLAILAMAIVSRPRRPSAPPAPAVTEPA